MGEDEAGTHRALGELRRAVDPLIAAHGGRIVGTAGDSLLADFSSVVDALNCAVEMQRASRAINDPIPPERRLELRIGVNLGDVIVDGDDIFGDGVNIAARLEALAQPGTVCISQTVYDQVRNKLDLDYRPLGSHRVKNIAEPVRAYAVGVPAAAPRPRRGRRASSGRRGGRCARRGWPCRRGRFTRARAGSCSGSALRPKPVEVASLAAPARLAGRPSVAVLPFKNLSGDASQDFFSDGITEDVITALGRFSNLLVIAKSASFPFKGSNASPAEIGRLLDARYLLDGSIRRAGDRIRVNVELTEAATGRQVWSETYDAEVKDIFAVQDDIARRVVGAAAVKLTRFEQGARPGEADRTTSRPTNMCCAVASSCRMQPATRTTRRASSFSARSTSIPTTPPPMQRLAARISRRSSRDGRNFARKSSSRRKRSRRKALALDPDDDQRLPPARRSSIMYQQDVTISRLGRLDRALEINPSDVDSYAHRGAPFWCGRAEPRRACHGSKARFALTAPTGLLRPELCMAYYFLGRYGEADRGR